MLKNIWIKKGTTATSTVMKSQTFLNRPQSSLPLITAETPVAPPIFTQMTNIGELSLTWP